MGEPEATEPAASGPDEVLRQRRMAERRVWRSEQAALLSLELVMSPAREFNSSRGVGMALLVPVEASPAIRDAVEQVQDMARQDPPPSSDWLYEMRGDAGPVVAAHTDTASLIMRSGGPYLVITDVMGKMVWRIDGDPVWQDDLTALFGELRAVIGRRPAELRSAPRKAEQWRQLIEGADPQS